MLCSHAPRPKTCTDAHGDGYQGQGGPGGGEEVGDGGQGGAGGKEEDGDGGQGVQAAAPTSR